MTLLRLFFAIFAVIVALNAYKAMDDTTEDDEHPVASVIFLIVVACLGGALGIMLFVWGVLGMVR